MRQSVTLLAIMAVLAVLPPSAFARDGDKRNLDLKSALDAGAAAKTPAVQGVAIEGDDDSDSNAKSGPDSKDTGVAGKDPFGPTVPAPADPEARANTAGLYRLYAAGRAELIRMRRYAVKTGPPRVVDQLYDLIKKADSAAKALRGLSAKNIQFPGTVDDLREALYTVQRAASSEITQQQAEQNVGVTAAPRDPLANLHRGDLPEPSAELKAFRKAYEQKKPN